LLETLTMQKRLVLTNRGHQLWQINPSAADAAREPLGLLDELVELKSWLGQSPTRRKT
jgi:hypothetical protein